jgi:signal transduction histidine kinase/DNA-binding response OmpR family regulator
VLLRRPLLAGVAAVVLVTVTTLSLTVLLLARLAPQVARADNVLSALQDGHVAMVNQETGLRGFLVTRDPQFLQPYYEGARNRQVLDARLESWAEHDPALAEQVVRLRTAEDAWLDRWALPLLETQPDVSDRARLTTLLLSGKNLFDSYRAVEQDARAAVERDRRDAVSTQRTALLVGAGLDVLVAAVLAVALRRANRRLTEQVLPPTEQVRETLADLIAGDLGSRAVQSGPLELHGIAGDVNSLADALDDRDALVRARERDLVAARDEAERAGHAKTAFLATMSHEIRTPLNAVLGLTDLLMTTELTDEQRSHLETISGSGDSLLTLINDILDFSKIEAGELDLEQAPFDLQGLLYDVAQLLAPQAAGKGLDLLVDIAGDAPWQVVGDGPRLRQVIMNLVGNAVKFTSSGQVVIGVDGELDGSRWHGRITVTDTGIGIPADQQHRLFRSFSQVDASATRSYGGTGLGLAISQRIVRAMGGDIGVTSTAGEGSTFTVTVALDVVATTDGTEPADGLAGRRVLVVDDNPTNLRILEHTLTRFGAECVLAAGGPEALSLVAGPDVRFDVAVLDLHMPDMPGDELAARLRQLPATADLPLVLLSSSAALAPARSAPFSGRLHKPVRPERLLQTLLTAMRRGVTGGKDGGARSAIPGPRCPGDRALRVLVAEDHEVNAQLITLYLRQLGHDSEHVPNGQEAVSAVLGGGYDVVLMDAQMPVLSGIDATAAIRAMAGPQPRIIAVTANVLAADRAAFLDAGADDFLTKPVRLATLAGALEALREEPLPEPEEQTEPTGAVLDPALDAVLDAETVDELRDLGEEAFEHLYRQFLDSLVSTTAAVRSAADLAAWSEDEEQSVPRLAHRLKGSSAAMGALRLADICADLQTATPETAAVAAGRLTELEDESSRVHAAVVDLLGS